VTERGQGDCEALRVTKKRCRGTCKKPKGDRVKRVIEKGLQG